MGWDTEFSIQKNNISIAEKEADKKASEEKMFVRCAECNELIGAVSLTLYEIDEKHYCSGCYSRKIIALAVERDHFDIKQEKKP
jgi:formylmethanofuran dehydrogenase subunit E